VQNTSKMNSKILKIFVSAILMLSILTIINYKKTRFEKINKDIIELIENRLEGFDGRTVDKILLKDKTIYLQYVNAFNNNDMELFDAVCDNWNDNRIIKIGFFEENNSFVQMKDKYNSYTNVFFVVNRDYDKKENILLSRVKNKYFIFEKNHNLNFSGDNLIGYDNGVKTKLKKILNNDSFNINEFLPLNQSITESMWLDQITKIIKSNNVSFHIFGFMNDICETCGSGSVVALLKTLNKNQDFSINLIIGNFSFEYSENEISALKSQAQIEFPIIKADDKLSEKWNHFSHEYSKNELNNIIFVIDRNIEIISIFYPGCSCWGTFIQYTKSLSEGNST